MTASTLVLWRHGRTASNAENRFQGQLDVPLDDVGRAQAREAAAHLAALGVDALVASDLSRAADTAAALTALSGVPARLDPALREVDAGRWQGLLHHEITAQWPQEYAAWRRGEDLRIGGGETRTEVAERTTAAVRGHADAVDDGGTLVVASHGAALKAALLRLLGLPVTAGGAFAGFRNAHWAVLRRRAEGWSLAEYNAGPPGAGVGAEG
ncbi:histidine phosphatase family protein [Kineococcus sp. T13]|uniref:histidine phosphatase family protein n=1 Tax=Kineococcus vitellinus TaxID=2696565 RepID=UPI001411B86D|nr:histidine phosphatase family protein [Kineococcus vitellinus]